MLGGLKNNIYFGGEKMASVIHDYSLGGKDIGKYNNKYLIQGGNNRLSIGKFIQIDILEYEFDQKSFRIYNKIRELCLEIEYFKNEEYTL